MSTREDEILALRQELASIAPEFKRLEEAKRSLEFRLRDVENRIEVGDKVTWHETCRRGCCVEDQGDGVVESIEEKKSYSEAFVNIGGGRYAKKLTRVLNRVVPNTQNN